jgi:hypothetical protein
MSTENHRLHEQLIKLGDMMGDGLHHESDGKWISKEYRKVFNAIQRNDPEMRLVAAEQRKKKNKSIDEQMAKMLSTMTCKCGGVLVQSRSGSKIAYCTICPARYKASKNKKP